MLMLYECSLCAVKVYKLCVPLLGSHPASTLVDGITVCPKRVRRQTDDRMRPLGQQGYRFNALLSREHTLKSHVYDYKWHNKLTDSNMHRPIVLALTRGVKQYSYHYIKVKEKHLMRRLFMTSRLYTYDTHVITAAAYSQSTHRLIPAPPADHALSIHVLQPSG